MNRSEALMALGWRRAGTMTGLWVSPDGRTMAMSVALAEIEYREDDDEQQPG